MIRNMPAFIEKPYILPLPCIPFFESYLVPGTESRKAADGSHVAGSAHGLDRRARKEYLL